jgi:hypothetical protein
MCSYETIFNSFGKLIDSYQVRNPLDLVAGLFLQWHSWGRLPFVFLAEVINFFYYLRRQYMAPCCTYVHNVFHVNIMFMFL